MQSLTTRTTRTLALTVGLTALAACGEQGSGGQWFREAGIQIDSGEFGNATMINMMAQVCNPSGVAGAGGSKVGGSPSDPLVVLDPASTVAQPVFRVHCDGRLDGKYARIIYRDYVGSASQKTTVEEATAE
ncbi:hypothetical protein KX928_07625 [Roseobacter sp. YSTF-M11]|uniref:Lipoprotein n=1 Tax=Roseobacter insulae TaxID=2859783 RepID=A0A9X1K1M2_9RHOB|nr:hypothetical protein [Roseobacter insulae]MBW4707653.1 hypothetical protein [Roseobacter insulae]